MKYSIPVNKLEKLEKIIAKYQKKGANIVFEIGEEVIEDGTLYIEDKIHHVIHSTPIKVTCKEVFVDGTYIINGWQFVGTIEFTKNGNIIRLADSSFEGKIPLKYLHTPKICEHCGKIRNRKDTYLICNIDSGEFKQVGSTCLLDYTHGLDADKCADMMSCFNKVQELSNYDCCADDFLGNGYSTTSYGLARERVLPFVIAYVNNYGYQRMDNGNGTAHDVWVAFTNNFGPFDEGLKRRVETLKLASEEEVKAIDDFAKEHLEDEFGYMRNASLAWVKKSVEYRDFGLIASFVSTYNKEMNKAKELELRLADRCNEYVGKVGDRVTVKVASLRLLYSNSMEVAWHVYSETYCYEIKDNDGHTFIWKSSKQLDREWVEENNELQCKHVDTPKEIMGTIKEHSEYNGVKQTVITRGKVIAR